MNDSRREVQEALNELRLHGARVASVAAQGSLGVELNRVMRIADGFVIGDLVEASEAEDAYDQGFQDGQRAADVLEEQ